MNRLSSLKFIHPVHVCSRLSIMLHHTFILSLLISFIALTAISNPPVLLKLESPTSDYDFSGCIRLDFSANYPDVWAFCCPLATRLFVGERATSVEEGVVYPCEGVDYPDTSLSFALGLLSPCFIIILQWFFFHVGL